MFASLFIYVTDITLHLYMGQFQRNLYPNCSCFYVKIVDVLKQIALMKLTPNVKKKIRSMSAIVRKDVLLGPRQANLVLIAYASSEGSGEPAHPRSLARTFAARSYKQ